MLEDDYFTTMTKNNPDENIFLRFTAEPFSLLFDLVDEVWCDRFMFKCEALIPNDQPLPQAG